MSMSTYQYIPKIRFALHRTGLEIAHQEVDIPRQEVEGAEAGQGHPGGAKWALVALGASVLYLFISVARMWGPTGLAVVLPVSLFGLTRSIYRAAALSFS